MNLTNCGGVATNIEGVVDAELLVVAVHSFHYLHKYNSYRKSDVGF